MKPPLLFTLSPELQRNIWLELTPVRLIGLCLVLGLIVAGVRESHGIATLSGALHVIMWVALILWGTRMAAESLTNELSGKTWDVQRLSAQSATGLVLGKLIGGTIFAWVTALLCVATIVALARQDIWKLPDLLVEGLLAQTTTLFVALALSRFALGQRRVSTLGAQIIGIVFAASFGLIASRVLANLPSPVIAFLHLGETIDWFGLPVGLVELTRILGVVTSLWMVIGMIRLTRRELGYRDIPILWGCFALFLIVLDCGFETPPIATTGQDTIAWQMNALRTVYLITYLALLGMPISLASLRRLVLFISARNWIEAAKEIPPWLVSAAITVLVALLYAFTGLDHALGALAVLGFFCRDALVVYGFRLRFRLRSGAGLMAYFGIAYIVFPFVLTAGQSFQDQALLPWATLEWFFPRVAQSSIPGAVIPWLETLAVFIVFRRNFLQVLQPISARDDAASSKTGI